MHCPELGSHIVKRQVLSADPSRSAFSAAVRRLAEDDSEIELLPGVQDLISGALHSRLARHSRQSVVDNEVDVGTDRSRGRGPLR